MYKIFFVPFGYYAQGLLHPQAIERITHHHQKEISQHMCDGELHGMGGRDLFFFFCSERVGVVQIYLNIHSRCVMNKSGNRLRSLTSSMYNRSIASLIRLQLILCKAINNK